MDDEKKWEQIRRALQAGAAGDEIAPVMSTRTLFGIKSHAEEVIEAAVRADEAARAAERRARKSGAGEGATGAGAPADDAPAAGSPPAGALDVRTSTTSALAAGNERVEHAASGRPAHPRPKEP